LFVVGCGEIVIGPVAPVDTPVAPQPKTEPQPDLEPQPADIEVLAFTAKWCPACQRDKPQLEETRRKGIKVTEIDVDKHPELARKYGIKRLPTYIVLEDGKEIKRTGDIILVVTILSAILKVVIHILF
jgi:thiol-disulfide isomerase/thioredoxin